MAHMQERKSIKSWEYSERLPDLIIKRALLYFRGACCRCEMASHLLQVKKATKRRKEGRAEAEN